MNNALKKEESKKFKLVFDNVILSQLKRAGKDDHIKNILSKFLNKIEENGPKIGKLIDPKLSLYELKNKRPPIRLYFKYIKNSHSVHLFEYELKKSKTKQNKTIFKIKNKLRQLFQKPKSFLVNIFPAFIFSSNSRSLL